MEAQTINVKSAFLLESGLPKNLKSWKKPRKTWSLRSFEKKTGFLNNFYL